ncbi:MAG TPA: 2TM domain-containing protein [Flavobacteriaceae bacterium]|nr:2TM domain-containing protein [Flavobacteriaceae bacterium]
METNFHQQEQYDYALKRVKQLKGFYTHLVVYLVINTIILVLHYRGLDANEPFFKWEHFMTLFFWGIGLVAHGLPIYMPNIIFGKKWEQRKIKEYMDREQSTWQ